MRRARSALDCKEEAILPKHNITRDSTPKEIINHILECEEHLQKFYAAINNNLIIRSQKELLDSLVTFKVNQISEIKNLLNSDDLGN